MAEKLNLWNQIEELEGPFGPRLSGEPEIVHEAQDFLRELGISIGRIQIQIILEIYGIGVQKVIEFAVSYRDQFRWE